ncbi:MAG: phosphatidylserine/phosphatidylglycerophosphate/cardiolipin synthase family protein [Thermomicrobiales bacterium]
MRRQLLWLPLLAIVVVIAWLLPDYTATSESADVTQCLELLDQPTSPVVGLFVEPDDSYAPVLDEIDSAQCEINLSIYLLSDQVVMDSLAAAHERGVRVRVHLEEDPYGGGFSSTEDAVIWLDDHDIDWRYTPDQFIFSHAKYLVIDRQVAIVMNQNLTSSAFNNNREFGIVTTDPRHVEDAVAIFESDWSDQGTSVSSDTIVTSPENSRLAMIELIAYATDSIDFYAEVVRDEGFIAALIDAERRGVNVRLIVNQTSDPLDEKVNRQLIEGGVDIRFGGSLYIHAKAMTFDGDTTFIGSQNPTSNSFDNNREVGMIVDDPKVLVRMIDTFARDWAYAVPISPEMASPSDISY